MNSLANNGNESCCELDQNVRVLREIGMFSGLPEEALRLLALVAERYEYAPGDVLCSRGDNDGRAFVILSGRIHMQSGGGATRTTLREFGADNMLGALALLGNSSRLFTLVAAEKSDCLVIHRDAFDKVFQQFPQVYGLILRDLVEQIHQWESHFVKAACHISGIDCRHFGVSMI